MAIPRASSHLSEFGLLCTQHGQGRQGVVRKLSHVACTIDRQGGAARGSNAIRRRAKPQTASQEVVAPLPSLQDAGKIALSGQSSPEVEQKRALHSLAELFPPQHVEGWHPALLLYFPLGCIVAALRMALWTVLILVDSEGLTNNDASIDVLLFLLGIDVRWHNDALVPAERHVLVSNHVSTGDLMMLYKRPRRYVHLTAPGLPQRVTEVHNHRINMKVACKDTFMQLCDPSLTESIHIFPEGGMTNGQGMMKFSRGFMTFAKQLPVVPVALRVALPWGLHTHTLTSSFAANMFWFCFAPWVRLDATVLPPMHFSEGEQKGKFVARVQTVIAEELGIPVSDITIQRKREVVKLARKLDQM